MTNTMTSHLIRTTDDLKQRGTNAPWVVRLSTESGWCIPRKDKLRIAFAAGCSPKRVVSGQIHAVAIEKALKK